MGGWMKGLDMTKVDSGKLFRVEIKIVVGVFGIYKIFDMIL